MKDAEAATIEIAEMGGYGVREFGREEGAVIGGCMRRPRGESRSGRLAGR
jgi:hypothetical protein